ncbi:MAG TPA: prepilin-type N-terminal cleavage/methylation domain-containing protein [Acidimicrobiales bacterium]|nr:prepilin-type N-terminal cleavage/methylation domain-containing protein [Acidimicrobiales bacterium]
MDSGGNGCRRDPDADQGFTLIELLIIIVILGIISAAVIISLTGVTTQSMVASCSSDASTVQTAVQAYDTQTGGSPAATPALLTAPPTTYLHTFPSSSKYKITLVSGIVMIAAPGSATPVPFGTPNACAGAG